MDDIQFIEWDELMAIHTEQLELYGGADGFTDRGVVESAFNRPRWKAMYSESDHVELAAEYLYGLATTQGFSDGNKRTAVNAALHFLWKNGYTLNATNDELYATSMSVSTKQVRRKDLITWLRAVVGAYIAINSNPSRHHRPLPGWPYRKVPVKQCWPVADSS